MTKRYLRRIRAVKAGQVSCLLAFLRSHPSATVEEVRKGTGIHWSPEFVEEMRP